MLRAHKIRLNPTPEQEQYFIRACGVARFAWNWCRAEYEKIKAEGGKVDWNELKIGFRASIDTEFLFVREVTKCAPEQAIADLRQTINTYYKVKKSNPKSKIGFPGFRSRHKKVGSFGLNNDKFSVEGNTVRIPKLGPVNMAEPLRFKGKIRSGRVSEKAGRWYLTIVVETEPESKPDAQGSIGIDFGLSRFATLSNGESSETQAHFRRSEQKLKRLNRGLARKKKGSANRSKWKLRAARLHESISNLRSDFLHKFTTDLVELFEVICIEDLNLKGLHQTRLGKSFSDAGIGEAIRQLEYKAEASGGVVQRVGRFFPSSKRCYVCFAINEVLSLSDREWACANCGTTHDRDENAAINIELEGISLLVHGSGYVGTLNTPVELAANTWSFGFKQVAGYEAGTFYNYLQER